MNEVTKPCLMVALRNLVTSIKEQHNLSEALSWAEEAIVSTATAEIIAASRRNEPAAQPGEAVSYEQIDELLADHAKGSREMHDFARNVLRLATPIAAAAEPEGVLAYESALAREYQKGLLQGHREMRAALAAPAQAAAVPEAVERDAARYEVVRQQFMHSSDRYDGKYQTKWVMWTDGKVIDPDNGAVSFDAAIDRLAAPEAGAAEPAHTPCGGCGATKPSQRCIGCLHPFEAGASDKGESNA